MIAELEQKRVGLLHDLVPTAGVVAALCDPHSSLPGPNRGDVLREFSRLLLVTVHRIGAVADESAGFGRLAQ
jgi:hypothetical protein